MTINQIFKEKVPYDILISILHLFNINENKINNSIIVKENINEDIINKISKLETTLSKYYIKSKHFYLKDLNSSKIITILKQILKLYNYELLSYEKYYDKKRHKYYKIKDINNSNNISNLISF